MVSDDLVGLGPTCNPTKSISLPPFGPSRHASVLSGSTGSEGLLGNERVGERNEGVGHLPPKQHPGRTAM
jgi:hypothetical protein